MSFYICHCGNTEDNHYFRHPFQKCCLVLSQTQDGLTTFTLNADNFPLQKGEKCSTPNCTGKISIHETILLNHKYTPTSYQYREVKFSIPEGTLCCYPKCKTLKEHSGVMTHHFTTKVIVLNKKEDDIVSIINRDDEDQKIINS